MIVASLCYLLKAKTLTIYGSNLLYIKVMHTVGYDWLLLFVGYAL